MGTLRFFEEVVSFKIRRTFGFADYTNTYILGCFCRESNINISNPKHTLFLGYKRTQAPNLFEWSI